MVLIFSNFFITEVLKKPYQSSCGTSHVKHWPWILFVERAAEARSIGYIGVRKAW